MSRSPRLDNSPPRVSAASWFHPGWALSHRSESCWGRFWSNAMQQYPLYHPNVSLCEGTIHETQNEPPCSTCRYTGMTVCAGLSLYFLKLANEAETTAGKAAKNLRHHKPFFYGGAIVWAAAGIYRSMLD